MTILPLTAPLDAFPARPEPIRPNRVSRGLRPSTASRFEAQHECGEPALARTRVGGGPLFRAKLIEGFDAAIRSLKQGERD
jgi:hypothetical protein